jgi:hypothetical protein
VSFASALLFVIYPLVWMLPSKNVFVSTSSFFCLIAIIAFRGSFGPDTVKYFDQVRYLDLHNLNGYNSLQPLWVGILLAGSKALAANTLFNFNLFFAFIVVLGFRVVSSYNERNLLFLLFAPILLVDLGMNTLRVGVALLFFVVFKNSFLRLLSPFIHISTSILIFFDFLKNKVTRRFHLIVAAMVLLVLYFVLLDGVLAPIITHVALYSDYSFGSSMRGLTDIMLLFVILNNRIYHGVINVKYLIVSIIVCVVIFYLCQYNYSFLRVNKLVVYSLILTSKNFCIEELNLKGVVAAILILLPLSGVLFFRIVNNFGQYGGT